MASYKMSDVDYWRNVYSKNNAPMKPSNFAVFVKGMLNDVQTVLEVGSGNGRDAYFWGKKCNVNAYDNATKPDNTDKVTFHKANMTEICGKHDLLYSRFSLHSVPEDIENLILSFSKANCKYIAIECRSTKDSLANGLNNKNEGLHETSYAKAHYRRYVDFESFKKKLAEMGFNILHASESDTYAPYNGYNPTCLRIIAKT